MVEKLESVVKWEWVGPVLIGIILMLVSAWAVNVNARVMKLEEIVVSIDKQNVAQQGQYELISTRLTIISQRLETLVQQHINQDRNFNSGGGTYNWRK